MPRSGKSKGIDDLGGRSSAASASTASGQTDTCLQEQVGLMEQRIMNALRLEFLWDKEMLRFLASKSDGDKVEAVYTWIQAFIVRNIKSGVLNIPPPIATRAFHVMEQGMAQYQQVLLIMSIPFPFAFAQVTAFLVWMYTILAPFMMSLWTTEAWCSALFTCISVSSIWSINCIASELEDPLGDDANDLPCHDFHQMLNTKLLILLDNMLVKDAQLHPDAIFDLRALEHNVKEKNDRSLEQETKRLQHKTRGASIQFGPIPSPELPVTMGDDDAVGEQPFPRDASKCSTSIASSAPPQPDPSSWPLSQSPQQLCQSASSQPSKLEPKAGSSGFFQVSAKRQEFAPRSTLDAQEQFDPQLVQQFMQHFVAEFEYVQQQRRRKEPDEEEDKSTKHIEGEKLDGSKNVDVHNSKDDALILRDLVVKVEGLERLGTSTCIALRRPAPLPMTGRITLPMTESSRAGRCSERV